MSRPGDGAVDGTVPGNFVCGPDSPAPYPSLPADGAALLSPSRRREILQGRLLELASVVAGRSDAERHPRGTFDSTPAEAVHPLVDGIGRSFTDVEKAVGGIHAILPRIGEEEAAGAVSAAECVSGGGESAAPPAVSSGSGGADPFPEEAKRAVARLGESLLPLLEGYDAARSLRADREGAVTAIFEEIVASVEAWIVGQARSADPVPFVRPPALCDLIAWRNRIDREGPPLSGEVLLAGAWGVVRYFAEILWMLMKGICRIFVGIGILLLLKAFVGWLFCCHHHDD